MAAQVVRQGLPVVITDASSRLEDAGHLAHDVGIRSFALLPLTINGTVVALCTSTTLFLNEPMKCSNQKWGQE